MTKKISLLTLALTSSVIFYLLYVYLKRDVPFISKPALQHSESSPKDFYAETSAIKVMGDELRSGNHAFDRADYTSAAEYYNRAMNADPGSRTFIGLKLIDTYEKMGEYSKALSVLDVIINKSSSEYGQSKAYEIRSRLLAAKAQAAQNQAAGSS